MNKIIILFICIFVCGLTTCASYQQVKGSKQTIKQIDNVINSGILNIKPGDSGKVIKQKMQALKTLQHAQVILNNDTPEESMMDKIYKILIVTAVIIFALILLKIVSIFRR